MNRGSMSVIAIFRQLRRFAGGLDYFRLADKPGVDGLVNTTSFIITETPGRR